MSEEQKIKITFEEENEGWRAADLMPGEGCIYNGIVYIALGFGDVALQTYDEFKLTPGEEGRKKKKHFFFCPNDSTITTLQGEVVVTPAAIEIIVRRKGFNTGPRPTIPDQTQIEPVDFPPTLEKTLS